MSEGALERLRRQGEPLLEELSRAQWLAGAGHEKEIALAPIYARHADAIGAEALDVGRDAFTSAADGSSEQRSARALLDWLVEAQSARALAELDEREVSWESHAVVRVDGREIPYHRIAIETANAPTRAERLALDAARAALVGSELATIRRERFAREHEITIALGVAPTYLDTVASLGGLPLPRLAAQCDAFLRDTQPMWDDVLGERLRRELGIAPGEAHRSDAAALSRAREYDDAFPGAAMDATIRGQLQALGLDPTAHGRIEYDTAEREGKRARAFCAPVRVPEEVHLVIRPHGGAPDWTTFLHELGHALHFANIDPALEFEFRWLGDNSVTEGYAMLFDHRMQDREWLRRYTSLSGERLRKFLRAAGFEELRFLRRYAAKLSYEIALHGGEVSWKELPALYAERLTTATGFRYAPDDAFVDVDPRLYSARYLQAWQLQAVLADTLTETFDEDWWRNPRAGPWLVQELFARGQRDLASELALDVAGRELSFAPLVSTIQRLLDA